jgi:hypothetical protein
MNVVKKYFGLVWMLVGPAAVCFLIWQAAEKLGKATSTVNDWLQWGIIILIFIPIAIAFCIFGWLAWKGDYNNHDSLDYKD